MRASTHGSQRTAHNTQTHSTQHTTKNLPGPPGQRCGLPTLPRAGRRAVGRLGRVRVLLLCRSSCAAGVEGQPVCNPAMSGGVMAVRKGRRVDARSGRRRSAAATRAPGAPIATEAAPGGCHRTLISTQLDPGPLRVRSGGCRGQVLLPPLLPTPARFPWACAATPRLCSCCLRTPK